jgi:hypothetical protein
MNIQQRRDDNDRRSSQERRGKEISMIEAFTKEYGSDRRRNDSRRQVSERRH